MSGQVQWLRAGWLIDGRGGPARTDQLIGLRNGLIEAIRPAGEGCPATALDFSAHTVLPALTDAHVHLALAPDSGRAAGIEGGTRIDRHLRQCWRAGVLSVRDAGDCCGATLAYKHGSQAGGPPVQIFAAGWGWHAAGRYGRLLARACAPGQRLADAVLSQPDAEHIKIIHSGINSLDHFGGPTRAQFVLPELQAAVQAAHAAGRPVMVHANGAEPVETALAAGCDSIEHGYFMGRSNLERMAAGHIYWVPTVLPMAVLADHPDVGPARRDVARRTVEHQLEQIALGRRLGVPMAAGTDAGSPGVAHGGSLRRELALLVSAGLSLEAAVACATLNASNLLGSARRGALLPGWCGDLIVVSGDPSRVLTGGAVVAIHTGGRWWRDAAGGL